jgi:hypothetical protein
MPGREVLGYGQEEELWVVLEEDGTEVRLRSFFKIHQWEPSLDPGLIFRDGVPYWQGS